MTKIISIFLILTITVSFPLFSQEGTAESEPAGGTAGRETGDGGSDNDGTTNGKDTVDLEQSPEKPGFGLQVTVFQNVRNLSTDFSQNFSIMTDYNLTPGDIYTLTVSTGIRSDGTISSSEEYIIQLQDNYTLNIPFIGTINVEGMGLPELQDYIIRKISNLMPVQYVNFQLTSPAQFNVFIYGGVNQPGYVVANPLMGVIEGIAEAGGFKTGASYRGIQLLREINEEKERITIDISKFYSKADLTANPGLRPGDKLYVPQADIIATIQGEVKYPGIYELLPHETLITLINYAGGMTADAAKESLDIMRVDERGTRETINVIAESYNSFSIENGDVITIHSIAENNPMITIEGAIFGKRIVGDAPVQVPTQPVRLDIPYYPGMSVLSVLDSVGGPTPFLSDREESYVKRAETEKRITLDIKKLWETRSNKLNVPLNPGDLIYVAMKKQNVFVTGQVVNPGSFPFQHGKKVYDYILLAGGIEKQTGNPEGIYFIDENAEMTKTDRDEIVTPGSHIYVSERQNVFVTGQVNNQGVQAYSMEYTVYDYLLRAGGIDDTTGDPNGIFFVDEKGKKTKVKTTDPVPPATHIFVARNLLYQSDKFVGNVLLATGWVTALIGVTITILDFVERIQGLASE